MKGSHRFALKDGTIVNSLPPEEEEKLKQRMSETFWPAFYKLVPKKISEDKTKAS